MIRNDSPSRLALLLVAVMLLATVAAPAVAAGSTATDTVDDGVSEPTMADSPAAGTSVAAQSGAELWLTAEPSADAVTADEEFTVTVDVENVGDEACACEVPIELEFDGEVVDSTTLEDVDAGATETVELAANTSDLSGDVDWQVTADGEEVDSATVTVEPRPAELWLTVDAPEEVDAGDEFEVTVEAENVGDEACACDVPIEFEFDGEVVDSTTLDGLEAGENETFTFTADTSDLSGDVGWSVTADGQEVDGDWVTVSDGEPAPPELWLTVDAPEEVDAGDEFEVTVEAENVGDEACACEVPIEFEFDGETVDSVTLDGLEAGENETFTFTADTSDLSGDVGWSVTADGQEVDGDWVTVSDASEPAWFEYEVKMPDSVDAGDQLNAKIGVENVGDEAGTTDLEFVLDGETVDTESVELDVGESDEFTLTGDTSDLSGDVDWQVTADGEEVDSGSVTVNEPAPASFEYEVKMPDSIDAGDQLDAKVGVENVGDEAGTTDLEFVLDGETVDTESVELDGGESDELLLSGDTSGLSGDVDWQVTADGEEIASGTVTVETDSQPADDTDDGTDDSTDDDTDEGDDDGIPGFGVVAALAALLGVISLFGRARN